MVPGKNEFLKWFSILLIVINIISAVADIGLDNGLLMQQAITWTYVDHTLSQYIVSQSH